jgi:plasmid stabilization system protein ParE
LIIQWTERAEAELAQHYAYIALDSPQSAERQARLALQAPFLLTSFPEIGRPGRVIGTRELVVHGTPFILAYEVVRQEIRILAVIHGKQTWPATFAG